MFSPKNRKQNLLAWLGAIAISLFVAFASAAVVELQKPKEQRDIAPVLVAVLNTALSLAPVVAIGLGLPQLGNEKTLQALKEKGYVEPEKINYGKLADEIIKKNEEQRLKSNRAQAKSNVQ